MLRPARPLWSAGTARVQPRGTTEPARPRAPARCRSPRPSVSAWTRPLSAQFGNCWNSRASWLSVTRERPRSPPFHRRRNSAAESDFFCLPSLVGRGYKAGSDTIPAGGRGDSMCQGLARTLERARQGRRRSGKVGSLSVESETPRWRTVAPRPTLPARPLFPSVAPPTQAPPRQGAGSVGPHSLSLKSRVLPTPHSPRAQPEWGRGGDTRAKTQGGGELEGRGRPARHCPSRGQGQLPGRQAAPASGSVPSARCPHMSPCHHRMLQTKTPRPSRRRWPGWDHTGWMRGQFFLAGRQQRGASCQACLRLGCGHTPHMPEAPIRFRSLNTHTHAGASVTCLPVPFSLPNASSHIFGGLRVRPPVFGSPM